MSDTKDLTTFIDSLGRVVVAELHSSTKTTLKVRNPAIINVQPNPQTGQISVQLIPFFFKEFQRDKDAEVTWDFLKANVVVANNLELDDRMRQQYDNMYSPIAAPSPAIATPTPPAAAGESPNTPVIKLFDD